MRTSTQKWGPVVLSPHNPPVYYEGYIVATKGGQYFVDPDALDEFLQELASTAKNRLGATKKILAIWTFKLRLVDYGRLGEVYRNITGRDLLSDREPEP